MTEQKQHKPWQEMTFRELDNTALIEHALSLGKKKGAEALTYLQQLDAEKIPFTAEMKQKRREELQKKKKREKQGEKMVELNEPLYTDEQIEEMFDNIAPAYDKLNHTLSLGIDRSWRRKAINWLKAFPAEAHHGRSHRYR